jgi:glutamate-1-semialdehyde 2,1-aminomutase
MADSRLSIDPGQRAPRTPVFADELRARLHRAIPGGAHTYSRGDDQFPLVAPPALVRGKGAYVWDSDGKCYLDYGMALRSVAIGYADERVNAAAFAEMEKGVGLTRPSITELEAAEALIALVPSVEMVKFAKNGSNVTTAAVKIARSFTGRRFVAVPRQQPFFSFDDWFIGTTPVKRGIPPEFHASTLLFDYGDAESLRRVINDHPGQVAAVILEPATSAVPCPASCSGRLADTGRCSGQCPASGSNFLRQVQDICRRDGALMILDEMITGFRWHLAGAQALFGVTPDLTTFGKAMANGFAVAAVGGRREVMQVGAIDRPGAERTFLLSTTHGAEMPGLGAFLATLRIYREEDVVGHLWDYGRRLQRGVNDLAAAAGMAGLVRLEGPPVALNLVACGPDGTASPGFRTLLIQELLRCGVMMPWVAFSRAHGSEELEKTLAAFAVALRTHALALGEGWERFLVGPPTQPVFRVRN